MSDIDPEKKTAEVSLTTANTTGNGHEIRDEKSHNPSDTSSLGEKIPADADAGTSIQPGPTDVGLALKKLDSQIVDQKKDGKDGEEAPDPFAHLPEHEADILRKQIESPDVKVTYFTLFRYASTFDWLVFTLSTVCAVGSGAAMPLMTVVFGGLTGQFADYFNHKSNYSAFTHQLTHMILYFVYLAVGQFVTTFIYVCGYIYVGEQCTQKIRTEYLRALLNQNIGYYDKLGSGEVTTRITADTAAIQDGISEKLGLTLNAAATFFAAFIIAFIKSWKLTLILFSGVIAIFMTIGTGGMVMVKWQTESMTQYAEGGSVAEEVLASVRNATAFNTQDKLANQYDGYLKRAEKSGRKTQMVQGCMIGVMMGIVNLLYGLAFWEGSRLLVRGDLNVAHLITVAFAVIIGSFSMGNVAPNGKAFTAAAAAGVKIFSAIARASPINPSSDKGIVPESLEGNIELKGIKHIYPSRPEVVVMDNVNLLIPAGKQTALVGASGSGKSTIVGLVERFYNPVGGVVLLDGVNMQDVNLHWLREQVSLVQQEPVLFSTTIYENIRYGLLGSKWKDLSKEKENDLIINAAKMANAHDFISALPDGYETRVGERGFLLSGGQKQRIAIARAVVSDPRILLLDEATSALDTKSEGVVQAALDNAAQGRTTIIIAHRLSTIKNADNIVVMSNGKIIEQGRHDELLDKQGAYYNLVEAQRIAAQKEQTEQPAEEIEQPLGLEKTVSKKSAEGVEFVHDPDDDDPAHLVRTNTAKSQSSIAIEKRPLVDPDRKYHLWELIQVVWKYNRPEWYVALIGFCFSAIAGGGQPTQSVFFAKSIAYLSLPPSEYGTLRSQINFWSGMYLMLAFIILISNVGHSIAFGFLQELLIRRARLDAFRTMLRQNIAFFDKDENTSGALTSFLSTSVTDLAGLSGSTLGTILQVTTTLVGSFTLALAIGWKLALVCSSAIPVLIGCGYLRFSMLSRFARRAKVAYEGSAAYACEATNAIRTVASLSREHDVWDKYRVQLKIQEKAAVTAVLKSAGLFAASQSLVFLCVALGFWYGGTLIAKFEYSMFAFFVCYQAIIFGAQSAGIIFSFAPDMGKARLAAEQLKALFDRHPEIDSWSEEGEKIADVDGYIEFRDVHFRYPTRPNQRVLRGLNISVKPGQYVALVGASGCGKSTTIQLMERFYDPLAGQVLVDGKDISKLHLKTYRSFLALVSQEPTLYQGTVRENILLGADKEGITDADIERACRDANIYDFVMSLPDGFNTVCGSKGTLLSGGQKQRIAIARALIRNPKILLLDEATSALDSESEKVVQAALDAAARGRTTVAVAHRLSTIQKADIIFVIDNGKVAEQGTHQELIAKKGRYAELVALQSLEKMA